jgi:hypothetical protein
MSFGGNNMKKGREKRGKCEKDGGKIKDKRILKSKR